MTGLFTLRNGREYRIPGPVILSLVNSRNEFILEDSGYICSYQKIKEGITYEFTITEFEEPTEMLSQYNDFSEIDPEYIKMIEDEELQWQYKLQQFRRLEAILKEEGII